MMNWKLKKILSRVQRRASPAADFRFALRQQLQQAGYLPLAPWRRVSFWWKTVAASLGLLVSLGGATVAYAYTSDNVTPDHPLYALRSSIEDAQVRLAWTTDERDRLRLEQLRRRMQEARLMTQKQRSLSSIHVQRVTTAMAQVGDSVGIFKQDSTQPLQKLLQVEQDELMDMATEEREAATPEEKQRMSEALMTQVDEIDQNLHWLETRSATTTIKIPTEAADDTEVLDVESGEEAF